MEEQEEKQEKERAQSAAEALLSDVGNEAEQDVAGESAEGSCAEVDCALGTKKDDEEGRIFRRFKIKDVVFLAIMSACTLVTGAIMPLVGQIPLFGIVQLCLGLQFSVFPVIGMMKVRKPGSLVFMALCCGAVLVFMNTVMFFCMLICAIIAEGLVLLIFRGYRKDGSCLLAGTVYMPFTLPFLYLYYRFLYTMTGEEGQAVMAFLGSEAGPAVGMSVAVVAVCFIGSLIGVKIARELKKAGVMKK